MKRAQETAVAAEPQRREARAHRPTDATTPLLAVQRTAGNAALGRMLQRRRGGSPVHEVLRTPGRPLAEPVRRDMEARLGADFSDVRLHTGSAARASADAVGARAYTSGSHVVLGAGGHDRHTLAHELTHVVQQRRGPVAGTDRGDGLRVSDPTDRFERAAESAATRALAHPVPVDPVPDEAGPGVERDAGTVQRAPKSAKRQREANSPDGTGKPKGTGSPPHRRTRSSGKTFDLSRPRLVLSSRYDGVRDQKLDDTQNIGFTQQASLIKPANAPQATASYYHFWQDVRDSTVQLTPNAARTRHTLDRPWTQDGPFRPLYNDAVVDNLPARINFNDDPGYSTSTALEPGRWLESYTVSFRWNVAAAAGGAWTRQTAPEWTSPVVTHTFECEFDPDEPDEPVAVTQTAAGDHEWAVVVGSLVQNEE